MKLVTRSLMFGLILVLSLALAACGAFGDEDDTEDTDSEATVEEPSGADSEDGEDAETEESTPEETETEEATPEDAADDGDDMTPEATETEETEETAETTPSETGTEDADQATPESDETATDQPDADEILENAAEQAEELETAKFELSGTGTLQLEEVGEISLSQAEGAVERPDRAQIDIRIDTESAEIPLSIVSTDDQIYFTDVITGEWQEAPDEFQFDPGVIFNDEQGIPALIRTVEDAEVLGTEEIDGQEAYQVFGVVDQETIQEGTSGVFQPENDVEFNVWIDQETWNVLQIRAEDPTEETDSVWEMRIFEHGEPVDIADPTDDS